METRIGWLTLALAACRFEPGTLAGDAGAQSDDAIDAGDARGDTATPAPACNAGDTTLRACFTFDGNAQDGSSYGNDLVLAGGMTFISGRSGAGQALATTSGTATAGNTTSLDIAAMTIDVWIRATTIPSGGARAGLVDSTGRYRIFLQSDGALRCALSPGSTTEVLTATGVISAGTWRRITCTYGGGQMRLYVDGAMVGQTTSSASILTSGGGVVVGHNNPTGENFGGALDDLRIYSAVVAP